MDNASLSILIADDQEIVRTGFAEILLSKGHDCDVAVDGKDCLKKAAEKAYDVLFLDLVMPKIDGESVMLSLRERMPTTSFVIISAQDDEDVISEMLDRGATAYLVKPIQPSVIVDIVDKLSARKIARQTEAGQKEA